jgi:hypothetical protein
VPTRGDTASTGLHLDVAAFASEVHRRLSELGDSAPLRARDLAQLFQLTFRPSAESTALLHVLQTYLLRRTLDHARATTSFYSSGEYRDWITTAPHNPPDLSCWPILTRQAVAANDSALIARDVAFHSVCHTSGATGPALSIYKSAEELSVLWRYYEELLGRRSFEARIPLILAFPNFYHGVPIRLPSMGKVFVSGVTDDILIEDAFKVLAHTYCIAGHDPRISVISGLNFHVQLFTSFLIERGIDPREFDVRSVNVVGNYLSQHASQFLSESWGAVVSDRFTLTESVGGATRCLRCSHYHLDANVIGEVLDVDTGRPVQHGVGRLVLTQLYPFVQMQPLIRYDTGDLVRRVSVDCSSTVAFEFLGKAANCVSRSRADGRTEWLVFSTDLYEALDSLPDIRRYPTFVNVRGVGDPTIGSPHIFTQEISDEDHTPFEIRLTFELCYSPHYHPARSAEIDRFLRTKLRATSTALADGLEAGSVTLYLRFVGPGKLGDAHRVKV